SLAGSDADRASAEEAEQADDDEVDGHDEVEESRHDEDQDACDQRDQRPDAEIDVHERDPFWMVARFNANVKVLSVGDSTSAGTCVRSHRHFDAWSIPCVTLSCFRIQWRDPT